MFKGQRMILKCGMKVRLGWVSRVPGLRKQTEIREAKLPDKLLHGQMSGSLGSRATVRAGQKKQPRNQRERYREPKINNRFSQLITNSKMSHARPAKRD
jgi:hypothetical protein